MARIVTNLLCTLISCTKIIGFLVMFGFSMWISKTLLGLPQSVSFRLMVENWHIDLWAAVGILLGLLAFKPTNIVIEDVLSLLESWKLRLKQWSRPYKGRLGRQ